MHDEPLYDVIDVMYYVPHEYEPNKEVIPYCVKCHRTFHGHPYWEEELQYAALSILSSLR